MVRRLAIFLALLSACSSDPTTEVKSGAGAVEHIDGWSDSSLDIYFSPGDAAAEDRIAAELDGAEVEIRVAMYNLRSARLGYLLLARQQAGVAVEVLWDAKQMAKDYNTLDDELIAAGLNVIPIYNDNHAYATLHDKLAVIDGRHVFMGSANWGQSGLYDNNETTMVFDSPALAAVVDAELDEIVAGVKVPRAGDAGGPVELYFSPEDRLDLVAVDAIDGATDHIFVAVFSLRLDALIDALIRAHERGVKVSVITDRKQSETTTSDERLRDAGIAVVEALNATTPFTAMHQKFMVVDGDTTLVGSYNWSYTATFSSYEDLAVIADDREVAAAFAGEFGRLWASYAPASDNPQASSVAIGVAAFCDGTAYGDTLVLVGDLDELGGWDPQRGLQLDGSEWPTWRGTVELRAGSRFEYKLVILRGDGRVDWESGANHVGFAPTDPAEELVLSDDYRY